MTNELRIYQYTATVVEHDGTQRMGTHASVQDAVAWAGDAECVRVTDSLADGVVCYESENYRG